MFDKTTMTDDECSPWPPVLYFTPEVTSGIRAAAALAFGTECGSLTENMSAMDFEVLSHDLMGGETDVIE